jgi:hypothetical protein
MHHYLPCCPCCHKVLHRAALGAVRQLLAGMSRLLPSVHSQVPRQAALVARAVAAVLADKRLLPSVYSQVRRQTALFARAVTAVRADKRLLP